MIIAEALKQKRNNFMLMRLVAAMLVIYGHCFPIMGIGRPDVILSLLNMQYAGGLALDIFFVISGFLIAKSYQQHDFKIFLLSRVLRIFPALIVCVLITALVFGAIISTDSDYFSNLQVWKYIVNNILLIKTEFYLPGVFEGNPDHAVNGSLWSLYLEFRLYFFLFALGAFSLLREKVFFWSCFFIGLSAYYLLPNMPQIGLHIYKLSAAFMLIGIYFIYRFPSKYLWIISAILFYSVFFIPMLPSLSLHNEWLKSTAFFAAGTFFWVYREKISLSYPVFATLLLLCVAFRKTDFMHVMYYMTLVYGAFCIAFMVELPVIKKVDLSYGVYLYGWPVQQLVAKYFSKVSPEQNALISLVVVVFVAYFSWRFIEQPCMDFKKRFTNNSQLAGV